MSEKKRPVDDPFRGLPKDRNAEFGQDGGKTSANVVKAIEVARAAISRRDNGSGAPKEKK